MKKLLLAFAVAFLLSGVAASAQESSAAVVLGGQPQEGQTAASTTGNVIVPTSVTPCESCGTCDECVRVKRHTSLRENRAANACLNCRTNGSYKYPVPRQYTYFWPGIYSQQTMMEYVAPYQGLKLRSPSDVFDGGNTYSAE